MDNVVHILAIYWHIPTSRNEHKYRVDLEGRNVTTFKATCSLSNYSMLRDLVAIGLKENPQNDHMVAFGKLIE